MFHTCILFQIASQNNESLLVLKQAPPDRIGHGTFMHCSESMSEEVVQLVRDLKIPLGRISHSLTSS